MAGAGDKEGMGSPRRCYNATRMTAAKPRVPGVLVVGDINVDILARIEAFPAAGEDCLVPELELHCGGVGANTAMALAHWGVPVRLCGTTGRDSFGELALGFLRRERKIGRASCRER